MTDYQYGILVRCFRRFGWNTDYLFHVCLNASCSWRGKDEQRADSFQALAIGFSSR